MELLFNTFWVKIIPSAPDADWQPNTKESHFVNPFTEVQMSNPILVCSDIAAVLWGFLLFIKTNKKPQRFWKGYCCYCLKEESGIRGTPGAVGLFTTISILYCLFIVLNAPFMSKTEAFNIFKACLPLSCGAHADGAKQGHPEFSSSYNWT